MAGSKEPVVNEFEIVIVELLLEKAIPVPATNDTDDDEPFNEKFVAALETEIVIVELLDDNPMPPPATSDTDELEAFKLKLVATAAAGTEIVTDPAPTPTLATPAPENTKALLNVPVLDDVVFPLADSETVEKIGELFEMVIVELLDENAIPPPATKDTDDDEPLRLKLVATDETETVIVELLDDNPIPAPATIDALDELPLSEKFVAVGTTAEIVIVEFELLKLMFPPATRDTLSVVPFNVNGLATAPLAPMIVMVDLLLLKEMFEPATRETDDDDPFNKNYVILGKDKAIVFLLLEISALNPPSQ